MPHALGVHLGLLEGLGVDAGDHLQNALQRAQLFNLLHRAEEIVEVHALAADLLLELFRLVGIE